MTIGGIMTKTENLLSCQRLRKKHKKAIGIILNKKKKRQTALNDQGGFLIYCA